MLQLWRTGAEPEFSKISLFFLWKDETNSQVTTSFARPDEAASFCRAPLENSRLQKGSQREAPIRRPV